MDSHIQIPKVALKEFANDKNFFFKYEITTNELNKGFPKRTFTEEDYYSEEMEHALSKHIETPLKKLLVRVRTLKNDPPVFSIDTELIELGWAYVRSILARNPVLHNSLSSHEYYSLLSMTPQQQHDHAVRLIIQETKKWLNDSNYDFSFMINHTSTPFVLPTRGLCECSINSVPCLTIPLNPQCAILLKKHGQKIHDNSPDNTVLEILPADDDRINFFNSIAISRQLNDGVGYVIASNKTLLQESLKQQGITPKWS